MATIALRGSNTGFNVRDDLSSQVDGSNIVFTTKFPFKPYTLMVFLDGLAMLAGIENDFVEYGTQAFKWTNDQIGPPGSGTGDGPTTLFAFYEKI